tara:strand:+ start:385 stop:879 length:495 start_codon:yes stop_codon:yes gene_type:complete
VKLNKQGRNRRNEQVWIYIFDINYFFSFVFLFLFLFFFSSFLFIIGRGTLPGRAFGTSGLGKGACADGYEGNRRRDNDNKFMTCHLSIKVPSVLEQYSITFIIFGILLTIILSILYYYWRQWLKRRYLRKKAERRRSRKSSESSVGGIGGRGASSRVNSGSRGV